MTTREDLSAVLRVVFEPVAAVDGSREIADASESFAALFGAGKQDVVGRAMGDLFVDLPELADLASGVECTARRMDGVLFRARVRARELHGTALVAVNAQVPAPGAGAEDEARREIERERAQVRMLLEHAPVGLMILDPARGRTTANRALASLLGRAVPTGAAISDVPALLRSDGDPVARGGGPGARAARGEAVDGEEYAIERPDGSRVPVVIHASRVAELGDAPVVVALQDLSDRKRLEAFQHDFLSLISHDLRTPLQTVKMALSLIRRNLDRDERREDATIAARAERSATIAQALMDDLCEATRLETSGLDLSLAPVDLRDAIAEALDCLTAGESRGRVRLVLPPDLPPIRADRHRLERVLINLIGNAFKFALPPSPIEVGVERWGRAHVRIWVRDWGPGMDREVAERVFDKYFSTPDSRRRGGTGLGLYICRLVAEAHGGRCWADSARGAGTTISVALPLRELRAAPRRAS